MNGITIWLTGLPCSGKTTIAKELIERYYPSFELLDGDTIRQEVDNQDFSIEGRRRHLEYIGMISRYLNKHNIDVICSFVSPEACTRDSLKSKSKSFYEVYVRCNLEKCIERDVKGMYKKALDGEIKNFTGISAPYEEPLHPNLILNTDFDSIETCASLLNIFIKEIKNVK